MIAAVAAALVLTSPAFHSGATIPVRYTCDGANISPPLRWTAPPRGTRVAKIAASLRGLPAALRAGGANSSGASGWTGPCPPAGPAHHYRFTLRALNARGRVLAVASLVGRYGR